MIRAKRIYEPKKDDSFDIQKVLGEAIQKSITSSTDQTKTLVSEFERMSSDAGVKKLEEKFYQYIKNLRIEKEEIKQDVYKSIENRVNEIGRRVENHEHKEYLTQEDKDECINSAEAMVNDAVVKFDNLFKPFLEQLESKSDKEHTHSEFVEIMEEIEENEKELEMKIEGKAEKKHTHKVRDIENLKEKLDKKADKDHKHDEYATRQELEFIAMQKARGVGGGGHVIQESGVVKAQRSNLNFIGATVIDDPSNNATVVTVTGGGVQSVVAGTNITVDNTDPENPIISSTGGGGASSLEVTQPGHGFIDLDWLYFDTADNTYKKAQSNSETTLGMWHVVEVVDTNTFKIAKDGVHPIANALAVGEYVLSPDTAGGYTQTIPGDLGDLVLYGMEVLSATEVSFYTVPAIRVGTQLEGTGTTNELAYWVDADTVGALPVATYPNLTELSYVKGVTSAIQTQLDGKQASDAQLTSLAGLSYGGNALKVVRVNAGETDFELATPAGGGDVTKVGTPVDNQIGVWTGDGTIEGTTGLTYDGTALGITGNITLSGTVDGRDVATDGTKLDGIESGADVTDATNVASAGAFMKATDDTDDITEGAVNLFFTSAEQTKLAGIESGAEVNNISDANATDLTDGNDTTLHTHDGRYYTETETDGLLNAKQPDIQFKDEGTNAGTAGGVTIVDFVGAGVTASETGGTLTVTIPGGGGGGLTRNEVTGTSQSASVDNGYITNNAGLVTVTLPSTASVGATVRVGGKGAGLWRIAQNSGQTIHFGVIDTTPGASGYLEANARYDSVELVCITADTDWLVVSSLGNINVI